MKTLIRYGEVHLKSDPVKREMLNELKRNLYNSTGLKAITISGRVILPNYSKEIKNKLEHTFGIVSFSPCKQLEKDMEKIKIESKKFFKDFQGNFAIRVTRSDKDFQKSSGNIEKIIGQEITDLGHPVDLDNPDKTLHIEIRDKAYLYDKNISGPGGMPLGTGGWVKANLKNKKDLLACWYIMKRGVEVKAQGPKQLIEKLNKWSVGRKLPENCRNETHVSGKNKVEEIEEKQLYPLIGFKEKQIEEQINNLF